jgi:hypothetical protein
MGTSEVQVCATGLVTGKLAGAILQADLERSDRDAGAAGEGEGVMLRSRSRSRY